MSELTLIATDSEEPTTVHIDGDARRKHLMQERHQFMLVVSAGVIIISCFLQVGDQGHIQAKLFQDMPLPVMCGSRAVFGVECPGCGLTRSFVALAGGDLWASLEFHRIGWLLALSIVAQIPYRLYLLNELRHTIPERHWPTWYGRILIALLLGNWVINQLAVF